VSHLLGSSPSATAVAPMPSTTLFQPSQFSTISVSKSWKAGKVLDNYFIVFHCFSEKCRIEGLGFEAEEEVDPSTVRNRISEELMLFFSNCIIRRVIRNENILQINYNYILSFSNRDRTICSKKV
jgi:hypothetical protein